MSCDLHTHSTFSDGTSTPEELVSAAQELGLTAVALCDHNDVDGLPRFLAAARTVARFSVMYSASLTARSSMSVLIYTTPERSWHII